MTNFFFMFQASSQCSYKSSPTVPKLNNALVDLEDSRRSLSPSSQSQAGPIKQEHDHHISDFHENMSLPVSAIQRVHFYFFYTRKLCMFKFLNYMTCILKPIQTTK